MNQNVTIDELMAKAKEQGFAETAPAPVNTEVEARSQYPKVTVPDPKTDNEPPSR